MWSFPITFCNHHCDMQNNACTNRELKVMMSASSGSKCKIRRNREMLKKKFKHQLWKYYCNCYESSLWMQMQIYILIFGTLWNRDSIFSKWRLLIPLGPSPRGPQFNKNYNWDNVNNNIVLRTKIWKYKKCTMINGINHHKWRPKCLWGLTINKVCKEENV